MGASKLPAGLVAFVKKDCPTCLLIEPVLHELARTQSLTIYSQDDPQFPAGLPVASDLRLDVSYREKIEIVPTLLQVTEAGVAQRLEGWHAGEWRELTGIEDLGAGLPEWRPGCGSLSVDPNREPELRARHGASGLQSRRIDFAEAEDEFEAMMSQLGRASGRTYSSAQLRALFRRADLDNNRRLDFHEFVLMQVAAA